MSAANDPVLLSNNENPLGPSPRALEAMARAAAQAHRYPDPEGCALKEALAARLGVTPAQLALGNGSNELIELLVHAFVRPGDEVVVSRPTFVIYGIATRLLGGTLVETASRHLEHDLDAMHAAIGPKTRLVFVCNPNNPTGTIVRADAWRRFLARVPPGVLVVSDEAYQEYVADPDYPNTLDDLARGAPIVILRTFSKVHGLAGARVGYAVGAPEAIAAIDRVRQPYNVNAIVQAGALAALDDTEHVTKSRAAAQAGRQELARLLTAIGLFVHPSHANFVFVDLKREAGPVCAALAEAGISIRDLGPWGASSSCVRITVGTPDENMRVAAALGAALATRSAGIA